MRIRLGVVMWMPLAAAELGSKRCLDIYNGKGKERLAGRGKGCGQFLFTFVSLKSDQRVDDQLESIPVALLIYS